LLLKEANLDYYETDISIIKKQLDKFLHDYYNYESIDHAKILDYLFPYLTNYENDEVSDEKVKELFDSFYNFVFQLVQIQFFEYKMMTLAIDMYHIGDDNNLYDNKTGQKLLNMADRNQNNTNESVAIAEFVGDLVLKNESKLIKNFDYDDDGFFIAVNGDDVFDKDLKEAIINETEIRVQNMIKCFLSEGDIKSLEVDMLDKNDKDINNN